MKKNIRNWAGGGRVTQQNKEKGKNPRVLKTIVPFGKVASSCIMPVYQINSLVVHKKKEASDCPILLRNNKAK